MSKPYFNPIPRTSPKWDTSRNLIEALLRLDVYGQTYDEVAAHFGVTRAQVYYRLAGVERWSSDNAERQAQIDMDYAQVAEQLRNTLGDPPNPPRGRRGPGRPSRLKQPLSPEQQIELQAEVEGCIDLVRQAASQFGITPRAFLHLCITNARSMV